MVKLLISFAMEFVVDFFQVGIGDVSVDLSSGNVGVAEH